MFDVIEEARFLNLVVPYEVFLLLFVNKDFSILSTHINHKVSHNNLWSFIYSNSHYCMQAYSSSQYNF